MTSVRRRKTVAPVFGQKLPLIPSGERQGLVFHLCLMLNPFVYGETPKWVLLQTVKTQMKCRIMRHFIRVYIVC